MSNMNFSQLELEDFSNEQDVVDLVKYLPERQKRFSYYGTADNEQSKNNARREAAMIVFHYLKKDGSHDMNKCLSFDADTLFGKIRPSKKAAELPDPPFASLLKVAPIQVKLAKEAFIFMTSKQNVIFSAKMDDLIMRIICVSRSIISNVALILWLPNFSCFLL